MSGRFIHSFDNLLFFPLPKQPLYKPFVCWLRQWAARITASGLCLYPGPILIFSVVSAILSQWFVSPSNSAFVHKLFRVTAFKLSSVVSLSLFCRWWWKRGKIIAVNMCSSGFFVSDFRYKNHPENFLYSWQIHVNNSKNLKRQILPWMHSRMFLSTL